MIARPTLKAIALSDLALSAFALALVAAVGLAACNAGAPAGQEGTPAAAAPAAAPPAAPSALPPPSAPPGGDPGFAPVTSRGGGVPSPVAAPPLPVGAGASEGKILAPGASFDLPAGWKSEQPSSSMRLAQAQAPGSQGPALLAVFHFGAGGGGGVESNLDRWIGQMELGGSQPERSTFAVGNFQVTWVLASGTLKGGTMGGPAEDQPGSSLIGAVVEGEGGPWFFKMTGPAKTISEQREAFLGMLRSAKPKI